MMRKLFNILLYPLKLVFIGFIYLYKFLISPLIPHTCIYTPTCSKYAVEAIHKHGVINGTVLSAKRILRCTPNHKGGYDSVPLNIKGEDKWLF